MIFKPTHTRARRFGLAAALAGILSMHAASTENTALFDFATEPDVRPWEIVNDGVMGGRSASRFDLTNGTAVFSGEVSLENNGGFASVRTRLLSLPGQGAKSFQIRVRGDGRRYRFTARTEDRWDAPLYQAAFQTPAGEWRDIQLPCADFRASFRGRPLPDAPPLALSGRVSVGFLIADEQEGPFQLEIARIDLVGTGPATPPNEPGEGN